MRQEAHAQQAEVTAFLQQAADELAAFEELGRTHVVPIIAAMSPANDDTVTVGGTVYRAHGWIVSLASLEGIGHTQVTHAAARAMFELAIDAALFDKSRTNHPPSLMLAWEDSAKLESAARALAFGDRTGVPLDDRPSRARFERTRGDEIRLLRAASWPNRKDPQKHPARWTGRNLFEDAKLAASLTGEPFEEYYATRFAELCWGTHGSGHALMRTLPQELAPVQAARAIVDACRWGRSVARHTLAYFGKLDAELAVRLDDPA